MNVREYQSIYEAISYLNYEGVTKNHKLILFTILANTDLATGWAKMTRTKIAKLSNTDVRGTCLHINELMTRGYLEHQKVNNASTLFRVVNLGWKGEQVDPNLRRHKRLEMMFEDFWKLYPRKKNKNAALKAYKALNPSEKLNITMMENILDLIRYEWDLDKPNFIPYATTYLNQKRWEDPVEKPAEVNKAVW